MNSSVQSRIGDLPISKRDAENIVMDYVMENIGNIPHVGDIFEVGDNFVVPIEVAYPRIITDEITNEPKKARFMNIGVVGKFVINRNKGNILDKPRFYDVQGAIKEKLEFVRGQVEKALVKIGADKFSLLPFPTHMHTPITDILSWLLVKDKLKVDDLEYLGADIQNKYVANIEALEKLGLIECSIDTILPGNILIGIESEYRNQGMNIQLHKALAYFFREGFEFIDSIRQVLGPHLTLSSIFYERSMESDELISLTFESIERDFFEYYKGEKRIKVPRYLIQLEGINLIEQRIEGGNVVWSGKEDIFNALCTDEIVEPVNVILG
jgi:hypothetical protein